MINLFSTVEKENEYCGFALLRIFAYSVMILSAGMFVYVFVRSGFIVDYRFVAFCVLTFLMGSVMRIFHYLSVTRGIPELGFERVKSQVTGFDYLSIGGLYLCSMSLFGGIYSLYDYENLSAVVVLFSFAIIFLILGVYGLSQRKMVKNYYELKKRQQEIIDLLSELKGVGE